MENKVALIGALALIIGALIAIIPQVLIYCFNSIKEKKQKKLKVKSETHRLTFLLKDHYRELAMHKAHKIYWYAQFLCKDPSETSNEEETNKWHTLHMESSRKAMDTEVKIVESFSQYYKMIIKFQYLTKFNNDIKKLILEYENYKPDKPRAFFSDKRSDLPKLSNAEEERLRKEYENYNKILQRINIIVEKT